MHSLKEKLSLSKKNIVKYLQYNSLRSHRRRGSFQIFINNVKRGRRKKFPKSFISGVIAGLCLMHLFVFLLPQILKIFQNNETSYDQIWHFHKENKTIADNLYDKVRVLCWILTSPDNHEKKAKHVKNTWGSRCNKLLFMSTTEDSKLGTVALPIEEGREKLWGKTKEAFKYIYEHHFDEYDWFLKADDDTYVIVENLRKMLYAYNTEYPIFLGCRRREIAKRVIAKNYVLV